MVSLEYKSSMLLLVAILFALHWNSGHSIPGCLYSHANRSYYHKGRVFLSMSDYRCMARVVPGAWCEWEPLEMGHGVTSCQKGLNIRWRRRICKCPPPRPIEDESTWCRNEKNATFVAQQVQLTEEKIPRLETLKSNVWKSSIHWKFTMPFGRLSLVTNSLVGCLHFDECYFHTGGSYQGKAAKSFSGKPCLSWKRFDTDMENAGMMTKEIHEFHSTKPGTYCRNPYAHLAQRQFTSARLKPWCFISESVSKTEAMGNWEYCDIRACSAKQFRGTFAFPDASGLSQKRVMKSVFVESSDRAFDVNADSCFSTCRFRCEKYAAMNVRRIRSGTKARGCQCFNVKEITDPNAFFAARSIDNFEPLFKEKQQAYNARFLFPPIGGPFSHTEWRKCYLYNSPFRCPLLNFEAYSYLLFASVFEVALPFNCYETNYLMFDYSIETNTLYGTMGNFDMPKQIYKTFNIARMQMSSRSERQLDISTLCSHAAPPTALCPKFDGSSKHDPNSYFNNVVDNDFHWAIFDFGYYETIALVEVKGHESDVMPLEVFVRSAHLPSWLKESRFTSSTGQTGYRMEYFRRASMTEQKLWWRCEAMKKHFDSHMMYAECGPHQKTRWVMLRQRVYIDKLEMKYSLGYNNVSGVEKNHLRVSEVRIYRLTADKFNCLAMHHPPMGPEYADYWRDMYSFDADGQPLDPPRNTPVHPQFRLPLVTHDSVHSEEKFTQEDWDVEACGDWEILENTTMVGVPAKLKITISSEHARGVHCYFRNQTLHASKHCERSVYFRVDYEAQEVLHYPEFGRSYDLAESLGNCQFVCAIARECKAFEFLQGQFCRLHLISYKLDTMFAYAKNVIYGRKSDTMRTTNPFTWNNPYHPYYRVLQDILDETGFAH